MRFFVESVGLLGPGLSGWSASRPVLVGAAPYVATEVVLPAPEALPAAERRRTGLQVRLALKVGLDALSHWTGSSDALASVFASSGGDGEILHEICGALATSERQVSPTRFHNSVHNAPAGYWSIALRSHAPSISICCYDWSFAAGLLEATAQCLAEGAPVLLISYELPYPEPLYATRSVFGTLGTALLLAPQQSAQALARIDLSIQAGATPPTRMHNRELEALRTGNPTGRALPLLRALAGPTAATITLEYANGNSLRLETAPV
jgi:hypothetical protein